MHFQAILKILGMKQAKNIILEHCWNTYLPNKQVSRNSCFSKSQVHFQNQEILSASFNNKLLQLGENL